MNITEQVQKSTGNNIVIGFFPPIVSVTASPQILKTVQISRMLRTWLNYAKFAIICVVSWLQIPCILTMNSWYYVLLYLSQQNILVLLNVCIHVVYLKVSPSQIFQNGVHIPTTSNICIALLWEKCLGL